MNNEHLGSALLAYLDDELSPERRRRVEAHLEGCAGCRAELARLQVTREGLQTTLDATLSRARLSRDADDRIRRALREQVYRQEGRVPTGPAAWLWQLLRGGPALRLAQAALTLTMVLFSMSAYRVLMLPAAPPPQETTLFGDTRLTPGGEGALRIIVRAPAVLEGGPDAHQGFDLWSSLLGAAVVQPLPAGALVPEAIREPKVARVPAGAPLVGVEVTVSLLSESGVRHLLFSGTTDAFGTTDARFVVPDWPEGRARLVVETRSAAGDERLEREVDLARTYRVFLMSDRPAYRPGQTVHLRALALDAQSLQPVSDAAPVLRFALLDINGSVVGAQSVPLSEYGVGVWEVTFPAGGPRGPYTAHAEIGDTRTERALLVDDYTLPPFNVILTTGRSYYAAGDVVTGTVTAETFYGMPVANGQVTLRASGAGGMQRAIRGETGADGAFLFSFDSGGSGGDSTLVVEAEVVDAAGRSAGLRVQVPVSDQTIQVRAMPESGVLKSGVENAVYLLASYPDGMPADAMLQVTVEGAAYELTTGPYGLAVLRFTPRGAATLSVTARDASGAQSQVAIPLAADSAPAQLLLHTERAAYEAGETLVVTALVSGENPGHVYLDVVRAGQMVATLVAPVEAGRATFALDLGPGLVGALELRAYGLLGGSARVEDTRLVVVDPSRGLEVVITPDRAEYAPGEMAHLEFAVSRPGAPASPTTALLGISIVDESVFALEALPPSFARTYFLVNEQMLARRGQVGELDLPALIEDEDAPAAQDIAARASWAGAEVADPALRVSSLLVPTDEGVVARKAVVGRLSVALAALPVLLVAMVARRMRAAGLSDHVLRRMGWIGLALLLLMPFVVVVLVIGWLLPLWGGSLFVGLSVVALGLVAAVIANGWARRDLRLQVTGALLVCYIVLAGWMLILAGRDAGPAAPGIILVVSTFLLLVFATVVQGQELVLEGRRGVGWTITVLGVVLALMAVTAPAVPLLRSELAEAVGHPALHAGPLGWLTGCGTVAPQPTEETAEAEPIAGTATPAATPAATSQPAPVGTPPVVPAEPYPLRQVFPETLYWNPEAETDAEGHLALDIPLADPITAWRVTALASTRSGEIGAGTAQLLVKQDLFVEVGVPDVVRVGQPVTLTISVYNLQMVAETVRWELYQGEGYSIVQAPQELTVEAESGAGTTWVIRPETAGPLHLTLSARGEQSGDRVQVTLDVLPADTP